MGLPSSLVNGWAIAWFGAAVVFFTASETVVPHHMWFAAGCFVVAGVLFVCSFPGVQGWLRVSQRTVSLVGLVMAVALVSFFLGRFTQGNAVRGSGPSKSELEEVREALRPRQLTWKQIEQIADRLRTQPGISSKVLYLERAKCDDGPEYARQFYEIFHKAGWDIGSFPESTDSGSQKPEGVLIQVIDRGNISALSLTQLLKDALKEAGVKEVRFTDDDVGTWEHQQVIVLIGAKPYLNEGEK